MTVEHPTPEDKRRFVDISGHVVTDIEWSSEGPTGVCPEYGHRVYAKERPAGTGA